jgi:hypothetical protein
MHVQIAIYDNLTCLINGFGLSEGYIFTKVMTNEFNSEHHQQQGT